MRKTVAYSDPAARPEPPAGDAARSRVTADTFLPSVLKISTRDLLVVLALAEHNNFIAAAAHLNTTQPIVTRSIIRIERILGVSLFARNTRRVEITLAGREFVAVAERALSDLQSTVRNINEATTEQRGRITISTFSAFATYRLPDLVRQFRDTRTHVEIRVREGRQSQIIEDVRTGTADFGIGYIDSLPDTLHTRLLRREPLYALVPLSHRIAAKTPRRLRLEDLREEVLVSIPIESYLRRLVDGAAAARGFSFRHPVVVDTLIGLIDHVNAGVGIAIVPSGALPPQPWRYFHAALVEPSLMVSVGLITAAGRYLPRSTSSLMALVLDGIATEELQHAANG